MAVNESTHMFTFGSSIGERLSEGTVKTNSDGSMSVAMNGTQSFEKVEITPGKDSDFKKYLEFTIKGMPDVEKVRKSILTGMSGAPKLIIERLDIANNLLNRISGNIANKLDSLADALSTNQKNHEAEKIEAKISASGDLADLLKQTVDMTNTMKWVNPIKALQFKFAIKGFASAIADAMQILAKASSGTDYEKMSKPLEFFSAIANLASETNAGNFELTTKYLKFANSQLRLSKKAANNFSTFLKIVSEGVVTACNNLAGITVGEKEVNLVSTTLSGIMDIVDGIKITPVAILGKRMAIHNIRKLIHSVIATVNEVGQIEVDTNQERRFANLIDWLILPISSIPLTFGKKVNLFKNNALKVADVLVGNNGLIERINASKPNEKKATMVTNIVDWFVQSVARVGLTFSLRSIFLKDGLNTVFGVIFNKTGLLGRIEASKPNEKKASKITSILDGFVKAVTDIPAISFIAKSTLFNKGLGPILKALFDKSGLFETLNKAKVDEKNSNVICTVINKFVGIISKVPITLPIKAQLFSLSINIITKSVNKLNNIKVGKKALQNLDSLAETLSSRKMSLAQKNIKGFAIGIATLGLTLTAFALVTPAILVASLGIKVFAWAVQGLTSKKVGLQMALFATSLAMFGLTIWAFGEVVTGESMLKTVMGLALLYVAIEVFSGNGDGGLLKKVGINIKGAGGKKAAWKDLAFAAASIATLGLALSYGFKNVTLETATVAAASVAGLGIAMKAWEKVRIRKDTAIGMALAAAGVGAMAIGLQAWRLVPIELAAIAAGSMLVLGGAMWIWDKAKVSKTSAISMVIVAGAIGAMGLALQTFIPIQPQTAITGGLFLTAVTGNLILLSKVGGGPMAIMGAAALAIAGGAIALIGNGLSKMPSDGSIILNAGLFMTGLSAIILGLGALAPIALLGASALVIAGGAMFALGTSIAKMTKAGVNEENVDVAVYSLRSFADLFGNNKALMLKSSIGATAFLPTSATLLSLMPSLIAISRLNSSPDKLKQNMDMVTLFIRESANTFGAIKLKEMAKIWLGVRAISKLGSTVKSIAEGIQAVSQLKFYEYEVQNGELKIKNARAFTQKDFDDVGVGLGKMISALTEPLAKVGEKQDKITIFGKSFPMPFGNDVSRGIKALDGLGELVGGIASGFKIIAESGAKSELLEQYGTSFAIIIDKLQEPLAKVGQKTEKMKILGMTFNAPWSNEVKLGMEALDGLGTLVVGIADSFKTVSESGMKSEALTNYGIAMATIIDKLQEPFAKIGKTGGLFKEPDAKKGVESLEGMNKVLDPIVKGLTFFTESKDKELSTVDKFNNMISSLATDSRWTKAFSNMDKLASKIKTISTNFNQIDLKKLTIMYEVTKNLKDANDDQKLLELINVMLELIKVIETKNEQAVQNTQTSNTSVVQTNTTTNNSQAVAPGTQRTQVEEQQNNKLASVITELKNELEDMRNHTFKVKVVGQGLGF